MKSYRPSAIQIVSFLLLNFGLLSCSNNDSKASTSEIVKPTVAGMPQAGADKASNSPNISANTNANPAVTKSSELGSASISVKDKSKKVEGEAQKEPPAITKLRRMLSLGFYESTRPDIPDSRVGPKPRN